MLKHRFSFLLFSLIISISFAQKEATHWYFGQSAGLVFRDGAPAPTWKGRLNSTEAAGAMCDSVGNLLLYSGGTIVLNRDHKIMPNGRGLGGHISSTESNLIVPAPGNQGLYYIFTTGAAEENFAAGMQYSVVDMSLDDGKGDVIVKNQRLFSPAAEKLAAIPHANGCDIWIIGHEYDSDGFRAYRLTENGIEPDVVLSEVGSRHEGLFPAAMNMMFPTNAVGAMATTSDGTRIAVAIHEDGIIELFDFDAQTGRLSNPVSIPFMKKVYGLAFSPDRSKLYTSVRRPVGGIYQFDLQAANIRNSALLLGQPGGDGPGAIQLGPDGRIYIARWRQDYLAIVNRPNRMAPACDFVMDGFPLRRRTRSELGLPEFMSSYLPVPPFNVYNECAESPIFFQFDDANEVSSALWDFGDPASGSDNFSNMLTPVHYFEVAGSYEVRLIRTYQNGQIDTSFRSIQVKGKAEIDLGRDTIVCEGTIIDLAVEAPGKNVSYLWSDGTDSTGFQITQPGRYIVRVTNECGAISDDIIVAYAEEPQAQIQQETGLCPDSTLLLSYTPQALTGYIWQDGSRDESLLITTPGIYTLRMDNVCGTRIDTAFITEANCDCELFISNVFSPNGDNINDVFAPAYNCEVTTYNLQIFDRFGRKMFQTEDPDTPWQGQCRQDECPAGVYFYNFEFQGDPRVTDSLEVHRGSVTLLR